MSLPWQVSRIHEASRASRRAPATTGGYVRLEHRQTLASRPRIQTRDDIEHYSRILGDWWRERQRNPVLRDGTIGGRATIYDDVADRVADWFRRPVSHVLCIQLSNNLGDPSQGMRITSSMVTAAWDMDYPVLSFFCSIPRGRNGERRSMTSAPLCEMMASLLQQMIALLPKRLPESASTFDKARFARLDGTLGTWNLMLRLFADFTLLMPRDVLLVIHGLECVNVEYMEPLQELLDIIRDWVDRRRERDTSTVKVLLVTEGQARAVVPWLRRGEHVIYGGDQREWY